MASAHGKYWVSGSKDLETLYDHAQVLFLFCRVVKIPPNSGISATFSSCHFPVFVMFMILRPSVFSFKIYSIKILVWVSYDWFSCLTRIQPSWQNSLHMLGYVSSTIHTPGGHLEFSGLLLLYYWRGWHVLVFSIFSYCSLTPRGNFQISFHITFVSSPKYLLFKASLCSILPIFNTPTNGLRSFDGLLISVIISIQRGLHSSLAIFEELLTCVLAGETNWNHSRHCGNEDSQGKSSWFSAKWQKKLKTDA